MREKYCMGKFERELKQFKRFVVCYKDAFSPINFNMEFSSAETRFSVGAYVVLKNTNSQLTLRYIRFVEKYIQRGKSHYVLHCDNYWDMKPGLELVYTIVCD